MPTRSRNARTKARQKRTMSLIKRSLRETAFQANKNFSTVLMLLAHAGGEVTVSETTIKSVVSTIGQAQYAVENTPDGVRIYTVVADTIADETAPAEVDLEALKAKMQAAHNDGDVPAFVPAVGSVASQLAAAREALDAGATSVQVDAPTDPTIAAEDPA